MSAKCDHTEPLVLDTLTIAEPSFKKSPVISKERGDAVWKRGELKAKLSAVSSELAAYKKKEDEKRYFSVKNWARMYAGSLRKNNCMIN